MSNIEDDINQYVKSKIEMYGKLDLIRANKVIHDPIHGSNPFDPWEVSLIDSPFCQRLRYINQTDVAYLTYPSAHINRLEHSLGVAVLAGKMTEALKKRSHKLITDDLAIEVRIAALLHDISHGPFSHLSEQIFKNLPDIQQYCNQYPGKFSPDKPTEMIAYLVLNSPSFQDFFREEIVLKYGLPNVSLKRISEMIIGCMEEPLEGFIGSIINGPFDADKLDYIQRDSYFAGLRSGLDVDRLLQTIWVDEKERQSIKVMVSGVPTLEQILFNKIMSYTKIYHHHKIRAAGCHIKGIFEMLLDDTDKSCSIADRHMNNIVDFLSIVDMDVLNACSGSPKVQEYIQRFLDRKLFKRALVISMNTVKNPTSGGYTDLKSLAEDQPKLRELRGMIVEALNNKHSVHDIWVDLPLSPSTLEANRTIVQDPGSKPRSLSEYFPIGNWLIAYGSVKWQGHVFCPPYEDIRREVGKKAAEIISDNYKIEFNERAFEEAKIE